MSLRSVLYLYHHKHEDYYCMCDVRFSYR